MRINTHTALSTPTLLLVPYSKHHVPTYHTWMQDPDLQAATASEPLTLDEEYDMQVSWRTDRDKLTFILCEPLTENGQSTVNVGHDDRDEAMIGDINLFLFDPEDEDDAGTDADRKVVVGEIELMIARTAMRRKGYGRAAVLVFLDYILDRWDGIAAEFADRGSQQELGEDLVLGYVRVKVNETNVGSIGLFEKLGFVRTTEKANYFGELELRWIPDRETLRGFRGWEKATELRYDE